jgi:hypothetical protein
MSGRGEVEGVERGGLAESILSRATKEVDSDNKNLEENHKN